jgi:hypothetical protein
MPTDEELEDTLDPLLLPAEGELVPQKKTDGACVIRLELLGRRIVPD